VSGASPSSGWLLMSLSVGSLGLLRRKKR
jgi:MYXO-CTERM domain-containing protein